MLQLFFFSSSFRKAMTSTKGFEQVNIHTRNTPKLNSTQIHNCGAALEITTSACNNSPEKTSPFSIGFAYWTCVHSKAQEPSCFLCVVSVP